MLGRVVKTLSQIVQPIAQVRVDLPGHPHTRVVAHTLDRRLRRQASRHRFEQTAVPAPVVGEHPVGLQNVAILAADRDIAAGQHVVDCFA